jgi:hypothetical protein
MKLYVFRTVPLSIIRSFSLYTQQWYMSYRFADSLRAGSGWNSNQLDALISQIYSWNKTLHVSDSSSVHHQEFFTVHTAIVYGIQVCWQLASRIGMEMSPYPCKYIRHPLERRLGKAGGRSERELEYQISTPAGIRTPNGPAYSQSLYRLRYVRFTGPLTAC